MSSVHLKISRTESIGLDFQLIENIGQFLHLFKTSIIHRKNNSFVYKLIVYID